MVEEFRVLPTGGPKRDGAHKILNGRIDYCLEMGNEIKIRKLV